MYNIDGHEDRIAKDRFVMTGVWGKSNKTNTGIWCKKAQYLESCRVVLWQCWNGWSTGRVELNLEIIGPGHILIRQNLGKTSELSLHRLSSSHPFIPRKAISSHHYSCNALQGALNNPEKPRIENWILSRMPSFPSCRSCKQIGCRFISLDLRALPVGMNPIQICI